ARPRDIVVVRNRSGRRERTLQLSLLSRSSACTRARSSVVLGTRTASCVTTQAAPHAETGVGRPGYSSDVASTEHVGVTQPMERDGPWIGTARAGFKAG